MTSKIKKLFILSIIIVTLFLLTGCSLSYKNKEKTIALLEKFNSLTNYRIELKSDDQELTMYQKDDIILMQSNFKDEPTYTLYYNTPKDEIIIMDEEFALVSSISKYVTEENKEELDSVSSYIDSILESFNSSKYEYSYIEKTKLNDEICIVVSLKNNEEERIYTISTITGATYKLEIYNSKGNLIKTYTSDIEIDCVTEKDVARPDLTGLKIHNL